MAVEQQFEFNSDTQAQPICIDVSPENDTILEDNESFFLSIFATPPVDILSSQLMASVLILNDDSKPNISSFRIKFTFCHQQQMYLLSLRHSLLLCLKELRQRYA